jgi:hypothetical protein
LFTLSKTVPLRFVTYLPKIGHDFLGHALYRAQTFLIQIWISWISKNAEFYVDFKNINLPL